MCVSGGRDRERERERERELRLEWDREYKKRQNKCR